MAALKVVIENLRLYMHFVNGVLLLTFVLACTIPVDGKELYEFLAVTQVDGLPPAPSSGDVTGLVRPKNLDGSDSSSSPKLLRVILERSPG